MASQENKMGAIEVLAKWSADFNSVRKSTGSTPLYIASQNGHGQIVEALIRYGADVDLTKTHKSTTPYVDARPPARSRTLAINCALLLPSPKFLSPRSRCCVMKLCGCPTCSLPVTLTNTLLH